MGEFKQLSNDVIEQIEDFDHTNLTEKQKSLIDKLILDEELKGYYKENGLCNECKQPKKISYWCQLCNIKRFQQNFKNWSSGNDDIDNFIQKAQSKAKNTREILEWIDYDRFENIKYLAEGGFGTVYKAIWKDGPISEWDSKNNQWRREKKYRNLENYPVALKCLNNSQNITVEFLKEIELHHVIMSNTISIIQCFGISKDPKTNNFMMVMEYAEYGSLRQHLNNNFNPLNWDEKLYNLYSIAYGLYSVHEKGLIHHDFHCGNILINKHYGDFGRLYSQITDLGLCRPVNESFQSGDKQIYGVLPYVAPEVLKGKEYTRASDIYGFGIIAYEVCTGFPPYHDIAHDEFLAIKICQGLRPKSNYKIPQLILDVIQQCWDVDPLKRPEATKLHELFWNWCDSCNNKNYEENSKINKQIEEANEINEKLVSPSSTGILSYTTHAQAVYTSRLLNYKNLPEPKNIDDNDDSSITEYSGSIMIDFTKIDFNS